jgi:hypothetical protein
MHDRGADAVSLVLKNQKIEPQMKRMKMHSLSVFFICLHLPPSEFICG